MITNIPTDLLRTLISVVEMRSFTKAAQQLGVTQPAVSAQIKRLQCLLGSDLLDKSAPGVALTPTGELVVAYARRLLSINDQILTVAGPQAHPQVVRLGLPSDCAVADVDAVLTGQVKVWPGVRVDVHCDIQNRLELAMRRGELDVMVGYASGDPALKAYSQWTEQLAWMRSETTRIDSQRPVPLVATSEECVSYRVPVGTLLEAGWRADLVLTSNDIGVLRTAVCAGLGVMVLARHRQVPGLSVWDGGPLPSLPDMSRAIYVREDGDRTMLEHLADRLAAALRPGAFRMSSRGAAAS